MRRRPCLAILLFAAIPAAAQEGDRAIDADLIRMETSKWDPAALSNPVKLLSMFSDEMLSVEYGSDLQGKAQRRTWREILAYGPLPPLKMQLGEWKVLHPSADVAILSYKVTGVTVDWRAYATSVWARREGKWQTVFYQASTAK
jgi:hypothetical protein